MINFPERLRSARKAKGWSLQELATQVGNISKQALGKYEQGLMKPEDGTLFALTQALGLNPSYFLKPARVDLGAVSFRKKASLKVKERAGITWTATWRLKNCCTLSTNSATRSAGRPRYPATKRSSRRRRCC
jgi:transcriptional regulator with XRE-family HTH domain